MVNTFCQKYFKAQETYNNIKFLNCSPDTASIDKLPTNLAYFRSLASNCFTHKHQLTWPMKFFLLSMMVKLVGKSNPELLNPVGGYFK